MTTTSPRTATTVRSHRSLQLASHLRHHQTLPACAPCRQRAARVAARSTVLKPSLTGSLTPICAEDRNLNACATNFRMLGCRSGCGWPAFDRHYTGSIKTETDHSMGMKRVEIMCNNCGAHRPSRCVRFLRIPLPALLASCWFATRRRPSRPCLRGRKAH